MKQMHNLSKMDELSEASAKKKLRRIRRPYSLHKLKILTHKTRYIARIHTNLNDTLYT